MTTNEVVHFLTEDGWVEDKDDGYSIRYIHPTKTGTVTVPKVEKELPLATLDSILTKAGLKPLQH